jgi:hypothetical protein
VIRIRRSRLSARIGHLPGKQKRDASVVNPGHAFDPEELRIFWELDWFYDSWEELKLTDDDLRALQIAIMTSPKAAPVMRGTKGLRKLRFSPESWHTGKSGALRVCYVDFQKYRIVLLSLVFPKGELDNLSPAGKKAVNSAITRIEVALKKKYGF